MFIMPHRVGTAGLGLLWQKCWECPGSAPDPRDGRLDRCNRIHCHRPGPPQIFYQYSIPSHIIRIALAVLAIPILAALAALLTTRDVSGTWMQLSGLVFGVSFLRWR